MFFTNLITCLLSNDHGALCPRHHRDAQRAQQRLRKSIHVQNATMAKHVAHCRHLLVNGTSLHDPLHRTTPSNIQHLSIELN